MILWKPASGQPEAAQSAANQDGSLKAPPTPALGWEHLDGQHWCRAESAGIGTRTPRTGLEVMLQKPRTWPPGSESESAGTGMGALICVWGLTPHGSLETPCTASPSAGLGVPVLVQDPQCQAGSPSLGIPSAQLGVPLLAQEPV